MLFDVGHTGRQIATKTRTITNAGIYTSPSLDLNFMSGVFDPQLTFTRASTATYFDSSGVMQTAATNVPRFDYDPVTHVLNGLLIEEQRTNSNPNGNATGAILGTPGTYPTGWTQSQNTGIIPSVIGSGTEGGMSYVDIQILGTPVGGTTNNIFFSTTIPSGNSQVWTSSLYMRLIAGSLANIVQIQFICSDTGPHYGPSIVPTSAPLVTQRTTFSYTTSASGVTTQQQLITIGSTVGQPTNVTLRIGGVQMEQGTFPTSYIPTTAAAATRSQDACGISAANMVPWFASPYGSWMAEYITLDPATNNNRIVGQPTPGGVGPLYYDAAAHLGQWDNVGVVFTANSAVIGAVTKGATTHDATTGKNCLNGGVVATGALSGGYSALLSGVNFLVTDAPGSAQNMTGYIRRVRYWPRVLSDSEMQSVTT